MIEACDRLSVLKQLDTVEQWDVIVVGGGILGAGIAKYATQLGQKVLLLEQKDFAWGSSSRSSKMVHGGLRYIAQGDLKLTRESVEERQILIEKAVGLVERANYVMSHRQGRFPGKYIFALLMRLYGFFAGGKQHQSLSSQDYQMLMPGIGSDRLDGGTAYVDALTDDARLVYRLIMEARTQGAWALNYAKVVGLQRNRQFGVTGVRVRLEELEQDIALQAKVVINATGAWSHQLDTQVHIRPLRGSHVMVPNWRLPVASVLTMLHPKDQRPVMIYPWQNTTIIGTTDLDHGEPLDQEPKMTKDELDYLLMAVDAEFPEAKLTHRDFISCYAGVRPIVLDKPLDNKVAASKEKRVHSLFVQPGFITVCGGKLTTFRVIAMEVMTKAAQALGLSLPLEPFVIFADPQPQWQNERYLIGRFGCFVDQFITEFSQNSSIKSFMSPIGYSKTLWAELAFAAKYEQVCHLDDLMLRRTRIGNVLPQGGKAELAQIKTLCSPYLDWDEQRWSGEIARYLDIWQQYYSVPES